MQVTSQNDHSEFLTVISTKRTCFAGHQNNACNIIYTRQDSRAEIRIYTSSILPRDKKYIQFTAGATPNNATAESQQF